jgi:hypothetical protein
MSSLRPRHLIRAYLIVALIVSSAVSTPAAAGDAPRADRCESCARDQHGRIARRDSAKRRFMVETGYPRGRAGFVIDHIIPLACGGADEPRNMQWQTIADAKAKDMIERRGCAPRPPSKP